MTSEQAPYTNQTVDLNQLPNLIDITLNPLDEKYPTIVIIRTALSQLVLLAIFTTAFIFANMPNGLWLLMISEMILAFSLNYAGAKRCKYAIREQDIISQKGLWQQRTTAVSFNRIQHIDISSDPLERRYNTATIKLFTAGGSSADLSIAGLPQDIAQSIRQQVLNKLSNELQNQSQQQAHHQNHTDEKENIKSASPLDSSKLSHDSQSEPQQQAQQQAHHQNHTDEKENIKSAEPAKTDINQGQSNGQ